MRPVSDIGIYSVRDFNLVFKLNTPPISTNPSTVEHTNFFPTNCTIHSFDAPTYFCHKPQPYLGGYIVADTHTFSVLCKFSTGNCELYACSVTPKLINFY